MIGPSASNKCLNDLTFFLTVCEKVGIPIKAEKNGLPNHLYHFHGARTRLRWNAGKIASRQVE